MIVAKIVGLVIILIVLVDMFKYTSLYVQLIKTGIREQVNIIRIESFNKKVKIQGKVPIVPIEIKGKKLEIEVYTSMFDLIPFKENQTVTIYYDQKNPEKCIIQSKIRVLSIYFLQILHIILFSLLLVN